jgi:hypothetical protein
MFMGLHYQANLVKKKTLFLLFCDFYAFSSLKNDVNVHSTANKQKTQKKKLLFVSVLEVNDEISGSGSVCHRYGSADPDPYQNVTDPQH